MKISKNTPLVLATHNEGKIAELKNLFAPYSISLLSLKDLNIPEPEETGVTFEENAVIKAENCSRLTQLPSLADDSGLSIFALGGQPGVFTARWAGPHKNYDHAITKIKNELDRLKNRPDKRADFVCNLAISWVDGTTRIFEGRIAGEVVWPARGRGNMGFDPIFKPLGYEKTFAEMTLEEKQMVSHRSQAFKKLEMACLSNES